MKKLLPVLAAVATASSMLWSTSCNDESTWDTYKDWREANEAFYNEQKTLKDASGASFYTKLSPVWYSTSGVLIHFFNDRSLTVGNLTPLVNSTVSVKYKGWLYDGTPFDSSFNQPDSIFELKPSESIVGWQVALTSMRVGDSVRVVIPWADGYGTQEMTAIPPFSNLIFDIKLMDIPAYAVGQ